MRPAQLRAGRRGARVRRDADGSAGGGRGVRAAHGPDVLRRRLRGEELGERVGRQRVAVEAADIAKGARKAQRSQSLTNGYFAGYMVKAQPVGRYELKKCADKMHMLGVSDPGSFEIQNSADSEHVPEMVEFLYKRLQRRGYTERDVRRMVNQDRNVFASLLVALGHGDALISGLTRTYAQTAREIGRVLDPKEGEISFGIHMLIGKNHTTFLAVTYLKYIYACFRHKEMDKAGFHIFSEAHTGDSIKVPVSVIKSL